MQKALVYVLTVRLLPLLPATNKCFIMLSSLLPAIEKACNIAVTGYTRVSGGDINESWQLVTIQDRFFLKVNAAASYPGMFAREAEGLSALQQHSTLQIPRVVQTGVTDDQQWLLLSWLEQGIAQPHTMHDFGAALAAMHRQPQSFFGWPDNNYIGSLDQVNTTVNSWDQFYTECRILPLVQKLFDKATFSRTDINHARSFCKSIAHLFPEEPPALLHGDLWSGNYRVVSGGGVAIFDPAVYCGHREMDLGMTKLFGGFNQDFYTAYDAAYPLEKDWLQRLPLTQLYPLLVHALLFGGHYIASVRQILQRF
jgi:fructosamine-3-kinase